MIKEAALNMANRLGDTLDSPDNIEIYAYALQWILMLIFNITLVLFLALFLGIIPPTLAFLSVFIPLRAWGGGVHLSTFPRCVIIGSFLILGSAYLAMLLKLPPYQLSVLFLFTLLFSLVCAVRWAPAGTKRTPVKDPRTVYRQKRNTLVTIVIWAGCVGGFMLTKHHTLALAMITGALVSSMLISPWGFQLMGFIDRTLNNLGKEVLVHDA